MRQFEIEGATAVITGAASGIGGALAHSLAKRGADVALAATMSGWPGAAEIASNQRPQVGRTASTLATARP